MSAVPARRKVVLVHRYFSPDTPPYANMLRPIAAALAARGHDVTVLTCQPSYNRSVVRSAPARERLDGVTVVRWPVLDDRRSTRLKVLNMVWFCFRILGARRHFVGADVVMAATTPPVVVALVCSWVARRHGAEFVYHKQDIYPEVIGKPTSFVRGRLAWALRSIDRGTDRRSSRVVVLSSDMAKTSVDRGSRPGRTVVLNNFDPWHLPNQALTATAQSPGDLNLVFAGNLGRFQGLEHLVELIEKTRDEPRVHWHFFGDGPLASTLEKLAGAGAPVVMHGYQPAATVAEFVRDRADLGVVSLNRGVIGAAYPSKTMTYLRNGCPVLALVEQDSELADMIRSDRIGLTGSQTDTARLAERLRALCHDPSPLAGARERAAESYRDRFSMKRQLERWCLLIEEVTAP